MNLQSFSECILMTNGEKKPHLLLGNGFSIACRSNIFRYDTLFEQANPQFTQELKQAFTLLETNDFEVVMKALQNASLMSSIYSTNRLEGQKMAEEAQLLKNILIQTIASSHPERPSDISDEEYQNCRNFLKFFGCRYTLNYDLLLYWTLMHNDLNDGERIKHDDGFRTPQSGKAEYVTWDVENSDHQNTFYLHGALHLFDAGPELQKFTWVNTGVKLIDQIRSALDKNSYPLFVAEGSTNEKKERINHSNYLSRNLRSFAKIGGSLFIYGHSFADNDDHILNLIPQSKISKLFVSIYGDYNSDSNKQLILKASNLIEKRKVINEKKDRNKIELSLYFYNSNSVNIWK